MPPGSMRLREQVIGLGFAGNQAGESGKKQHSPRIMACEDNTVIRVTTLQSLILIVELKLFRGFGFIAGLANRCLVFIRPLIIGVIIVVHGAGGGWSVGFLLRHQREQFRILFGLHGSPPLCVHA